MPEQDHYFRVRRFSRRQPEFEQALERCVTRLLAAMPVIGARNPKIGTRDGGWEYCLPGDWVASFLCGQYWLAFQLTGRPEFLNAARLRNAEFHQLLAAGSALDHDLGFQYSLSAVADWRSTGNVDARELGIRAAKQLLELYRPAGRYIQAWVPNGDDGHAEFVAGRMIADTMQNVALLFWAGAETGEQHFIDVANAHCHTTADHICRKDGTSFHTFRFDPDSGAPIAGETHQGHAHDSCWSRGQAWLIHGFSQSFATTGDTRLLQSARDVAGAVEHLLQGDVPRWDYTAPTEAGEYLDSSAGAITAAGLYLLAGQVEDEESKHWTALADRLLLGLLEHCDLTRDDDALGLLDHGAAFAAAGKVDNMLPYGDYYFMEALMRALGHQHFFW